MHLVYRVMEGSASIEQVRAVLNEIEERHSVFLRPVDETLERPFAGLAFDDKLLGSAFYPFSNF